MCFNFTVETKAQEKPRTTISVVQYSGEEKDYIQFLRILKQRVTKFKEVYAQKEGFGYLIDMNVEKAGSPNSFEEFWREKNALEVLNSSTKLKNDKLIVVSDVYLCDLKGKLLKNSVILEQMLSTDDFRLTRDTYTMIILYALAMDAKRMNRAPNVIAGYLKDAEEIAGDIPIRARKGDIALLIEAIKNESQALKKGIIK